MITSVVGSRSLEVNGAEVPWVGLQCEGLWYFLIILTYPFDDVFHEFHFISI